MSEPVVVYITASNEEEASRVARELVGKKLAACVNIVSPVRSIYLWQGNIEDDRELLLVVKTDRHLLDRLSQAVQDVHSYDVPEIIALPIIGGSPDYLKWMKESTD